jgi:hypothetical protein
MTPETMKVHLALPDRTLIEYLFYSARSTLARYCSFLNGPRFKKIVCITERKEMVHKLNPTPLINGGAGSNLLPARGGTELNQV